MSPIYYLTFNSSRTLPIKVTDVNGKYYGFSYVVPEYVTFLNFMPSDAMSQAAHIVVNDNGCMYWIKRDYKYVGQSHLTTDENNQLLLQILQSEDWPFNGHQT